MIKTLFTIVSIGLCILMQNNDAFGVPAESNSYVQYLDKVWVYEEFDFESGSYDTPSFIIKRIEGCMIEGYVEPTAGESLQRDDGFYYMAPYKFLGYIQGDEAICGFDNGREAGTMRITFIDKDCVEASFTYAKAEPSEYDDKIAKDGVFRMRPLCLEDGHYDVNEEEMVPITLADGREACLLPAECMVSHPFPTVCLADMEGNLYAVFDSPYNGNQIESIEVKDINGDGLEDFTFMVKKFDVIDVYLQDRDRIFLYYPIEKCSLLPEGRPYSEGDGRTENTAPLIDKLSSALRDGTAEELLQGEHEEPEEMTEGRLYELEEYGRIGEIERFQRSALYRDERATEEAWYEVVQNDERRDIIARLKKGDKYYYYTFQYKTPSQDEYKMQWYTGWYAGMECTADTGEHYFLECGGIKYLCIPERDLSGEITKVTVYNYENVNDNSAEMWSDDYFGSAIEIDGSGELTVTTYDYMYGVGR